MLFYKDIESSCGYCFFGTDLGCEEILCIKRGIMASHGSCSAFRYEPTKRRPNVPQCPDIADFTEKDFSLDS